MRGAPKWLNSREDVYTVAQLALDGQLDREEVKKKIQSLMSDEKVYVFDRIVNQNYTAGQDENVCETKKEDGTVEYHCYKLQDNPNARYLQMGMTKEEIQTILNELEG